MKNVMKIKLACIMLLVAIIPNLYAQKNVTRSVWTVQPKRIDGNLNDWKLPFKNTDENSKLSYSIANDSAYLYICLTTDEQLTQNKISLTGVNIWLDGTGKKQQTSGIGFPVTTGRRPGPPQQPDGPAGQTFDMTKIQQQILSGFNTIKINNLNYIPAKTLPLQNQFGIQAAIKWDSVNMVIEYKIPLAGFNHPADTTKTFSLGIELPALDMSGMPQGPPPGMDGGMGGPPPGEGGGPEGDIGGGEGMGPPPPGGDFSEMTKADIIWLKLKSATH